MGNKALDLIRKQREDVVLLDLTIPGKMAWKILQELRTNDPTFPCSFCVLILKIS